MKEMPKALLFELFGTVVDWRPAPSRAKRRRCARRRKFSLDWDAFARD